jgi:hypothetical protein
VLVSTAAAAVAAVAAGGSDLSMIAIVLFVLVCPGLALVPLLGLDDVWAEVTLAFAVSVTVSTVVATTLLFAGLWSPTAIFIGLATISLAGAGLQLQRARQK